MLTTMETLQGRCGFSPGYDDQPFRVVLAFDSFKGSLTADAACAASAEAIEATFGDSVTVSSFPMADGGEGSLDLVARTTNVKEVQIQTIDAIGRPIVATYLLSFDGRHAHIEVARACGLPQVSEVPLRPLEASTLGVGSMIRHSLLNGATHIVLYLGGTASTDAGSGVLTALGVQFLDAAGRELPSGGGSLARLEQVDIRSLLPAARSAAWTIVTDVDAPLTGPNGAAHVFAPQKGATPDQVNFLDTALTRAAQITAAVTQKEVGRRPGSGAAGGLAALLDAVIGVTVVSGSVFFAEQSGLIGALPMADLVITGEGRLDSQSLGGKVVGTIADLASAMTSPPPVVAIAGSVDRASLGHGSGLRAAFSLADGPADLRSLSDRAARLLAECSVDVVALCRGALITG